MIRFFTLAFAVLALASQGSSLAATQDRDVRPTVLSISRVVDAETQTITITGYGFGYNQPYEGDSSFLWMVDIQGNGTGWWRAGCPQQYGPCGTWLIVSSWTPKRIVITGFANGMWPTKGDLVNFFIWNPQTGRGTGAAAGMVR
jgi:hypothetical protein